MSSIGILDFIRMDGDEIAPLSVQVKEFDRPGIPGAGFWLGAAKAADCRKYTVEGVANVSTANDAEEDYKSLKGSLVAVVDDHGRTNGFVMVKDVRVVRKTPLIMSVPDNFAYLVEAEWVLKSTI